jgi:hypothetical protein
MFFATSSGAVKAFRRYSGILQGTSGNQISRQPNEKKIRSSRHFATLYGIQLFQDQASNRDDARYSLISQGDHRIDAHRAASGNVTCKQRHRIKHERDTGKGQRITAGNSEE